MARTTQRSKLRVLGLLSTFALSVLVASVLLVGMAQGGVQAQSPYPACDVNQSGAETITDALLVSQHVVGLTELTGVSLDAGDCNGDGNVTISDGLLIAQRVVGLA